MNKSDQAAFAQAKTNLLATMDYETLLSRLVVKDKQRFEAQVTNAETKVSPTMAERWRRLSCVMFTLAPNPPKLTGVHTVQFYIPDGKYRKQMFALHALEHGALAVYLPNVLVAAQRMGIVIPVKPAPADGTSNYRVIASGESITIDALDTNTPNPEFFYKDMTGWNRLAVRVTLSALASDAQLTATEQLCALAALEWAAVAA